MPAVNRNRTALRRGPAQLDLALSGRQCPRVSSRNPSASGRGLTPRQRALVALVRRGPAARPDHAPWPMALSVADAHRALDALAVVQLAPEVAYDRTTDFGPAWADVDHNGCGTRDDVLRRDLTAVRTRPGTHGCVVVAGLLDDPYTGTQLAFSKSQADAIQIDHLIPLHAAWMLGAWQWTPERRLAQADAALVRANLAEHGFHLQLPPQPLAPVKIARIDGRDD